MFFHLSFFLYIMHLISYQKKNKWLAKQIKKHVHVLSLKVYHSFSIFFEEIYTFQVTSPIQKCIIIFMLASYCRSMPSICNINMLSPNLSYQSTWTLQILRRLEEKKMELKTKTWFLVTLKWKARAKKWLLLVQLLKRDVDEGLNSLKQEEIEAKVRELI